MYALYISTYNYRPLGILKYGIVYSCKFTHVYIYIYIFIYLYVCVCVHRYINDIYTYDIHIHTYAHMYVYVYVYLYVYMWIACGSFGQTSQQGAPGALDPVTPRPWHNLGPCKILLARSQDFEW